MAIGNSREREICVRMATGLKKCMCVCVNLCINDIVLARDVIMETESNCDDCIKDVVEYLSREIITTQSKIPPFMPVRGCFHLKVSTVE